MIHEKLMRIQTEIKAPKNLWNDYGKYKYRNAEGICEAVKPYLAKEKCTLVLADDIISVADRIYVKATAILTDIETGETVSASATARESLAKKGMDESQITGTASSYARKYALNGLFLLDDTKDPDSNEYHEEKEAKAEQQKNEEEFEKIKSEKINTSKVKALESRCKNDGVPVDYILRSFKIDSLSDMTEEQFSKTVNHWNTVVEKAKK